MMKPHLTAFATSVLAAESDYKVTPKKKKSYIINRQLIEFIATKIIQENDSTSCFLSRSKITLEKSFPKGNSLHA